MGLLLTLKRVLTKEGYTNDPRGNFKEKNVRPSNDLIFPCSLPVIVSSVFTIL